MLVMAAMPAVVGATLISETWLVAPKANHKASTNLKAIPRNPLPYPEARISNLTSWSIGCFGLSIGVLGLCLLRSGRKLKSDGDSFTSEQGVVVPFSKILTIDDSKWANRGLAYVHFIDGDRPRTVTIDDLHFHGAHRIFEQLTQYLSAEYERQEMAKAA